MSTWLTSRRSIARVSRAEWQPARAAHGDTRGSHARLPRSSRCKTPSEVLPWHRRAKALITRRLKLTPLASSSRSKALGQRWTLWMPTFCRRGHPHRLLSTWAPEQARPSRARGTSSSSRMRLTAYSLSPISHRLLRSCTTRTASGRPTRPETAIASTKTQMSQQTLSTSTTSPPPIHPVAHTWRP